MGREWLLAINYSDSTSLLNRKSGGGLTAAFQCAIGVNLSLTTSEIEQVRACAVHIPKGVSLARSFALIGTDRSPRELDGGWMHLGSHQTN